MPKVYDLEHKLSLNEYAQKTVRWFINNEPHMLWQAIVNNEVHVTAQARVLLKKKKKVKAQQYMPEYTIASRELKAAMSQRYSRDLLSV